MAIRLYVVRRCGSKRVHGKPSSHVASPGDLCGVRLRFLQIGAHALLGCYAWSLHADRRSFVLADTCDFCFIVVKQCRALARPGARQDLDEDEVGGATSWTEPSATSQVQDPPRAPGAAAPTLAMEQMSWQRRRSVYEKTKFARAMLSHTWLRQAGQLFLFWATDGVASGLSKMASSRGRLLGCLVL